MGWRKWRSSPSLIHQTDLDSIKATKTKTRVEGPYYGTLRKGKCSCILCSFAPTYTSTSTSTSTYSHPSKKSSTGSFPRSIRFPRIPPSLLSSSNSTSFFSSPRSSAPTLSSFPSSPCLRYMRKKRGRSRARLGNSCERGREGRVGRENGRDVDDRIGSRELQVETVPRRWHSVQSLLCHRRWDSNYNRGWIG